MSYGKKNLSRRDFLQQTLGATAALSPMSLFLGNVFSNFIFKSEALAQGVEPERLMSMFNCYMSGGPGRWMWDLPLSSNEFDDLANPMLITQYGGGAAGTPGRYRSFKVGDTFLPWFWSGNLPTSDGGVIPAAELARNMFIIRGVESPTDGHAQNAAKMLSPIEGTNVTGLVADGSSRPIPSIGLLGTSPFFKSGKGVNHAIASASSSMLKSAMAPYILSHATSSSLGGILTADSTFGFPKGVSNSQEERIFDDFLAAMAKNSGELHRYLPSTYRDRQNAKKLMQNQYGDLVQAYTSIYNKYNSLVSRALKSSESDLQIVGVDDLALVGNKDNPHFRMSISHSGVASSERPTYSGLDLRSGFNSSSLYIINLIDTFVLAEYMLKNKLSQSVYGSIGSIKGLTLDRIHYFPGGVETLLAGASYDYSFDQHFDGAAVTLLMNTRYFKAISACQYELITVLKAEGLFNQTMINNVSEFSRSTQINGVGTGHGFKGGVFSFLNGRVAAPTVVGNIGYEKVGTVSLTDKGIWGAAAPLESLGGRKLSPGNVASTISAIVGVPSPSPNNIALAKIEGDFIIPIVNEKKTIT